MCSDVHLCPGLPNREMAPSRRMSQVERVGEWACGLLPVTGWCCNPHRRIVVRPANGLSGRGEIGSRRTGRTEIIQGRVGALALLGLAASDGPV